MLYTIIVTHTRFTVCLPHHACKIIPTNSCVMNGNACLDDNIPFEIILFETVALWFSNETFQIHQLTGSPASSPIFQPNVLSVFLPPKSPPSLIYPLSPCQSIPISPHLSSTAVRFSAQIQIFPQFPTHLHLIFPPKSLITFQIPTPSPTRKRLPSTYSVLGLVGTH